MSIEVILNLVVFVGILFLLWKFSQGDMKLSRKVIMGLFAGVAFGFALQLLYGGSGTIRATLEWTNVVANGYISLLYMVIMPLIVISMIAAVTRIDQVASLGKIGGSVVGVLVFTTMISAVVAIVITGVFDLSAEGLISGDREAARLASIEGRQGSVAANSVPSMLVSFIPRNVFSSLAGAAGPMSIISVVVFSILFGVAALKATNEHPEHKEAFSKGVDVIQAVIMKLVQMIMAFTPYGVMALMVRVVASSNLADILNLAKFIIASYVAIGIMFVVHGLLLSVVGFNPKKFFSGVYDVLVFAFTSRSSAACIPLNVQAQTTRLGVPKAIANIAATFGATIGQNGCAGIYPTMLALMVAPTVGVEVDLAFMAMLVGIVTISSFGVAGIGGGATFAAMIVLPAMGLPIEIVALLISIEPLIDMARTALNVNGAMTAGVITSRFVKVADTDAAEQPAE